MPKNDIPRFVDDMLGVIACPLCDSKIEPTDETTTTIWVCSDCDFVGFRFSEDEEERVQALDDLKTVLASREP